MLSTLKRLYRDHDLVSVAQLWRAMGSPPVADYYAELLAAWRAGIVSLRGSDGYAGRPEMELVYLDERLAYVKLGRLVR